MNESNAPQLPVLLATKLLPAMEAQEATLLARHAADAGHLHLADQLARVEVQFLSGCQLCTNLPRIASC